VLGGLQNEELWAKRLWLSRLWLRSKINASFFHVFFNFISIILLVWLTWFSLRFTNYFIFILYEIHFCYIVLLLLMLLLFMMFLLLLLFCFLLCCCCFCYYFSLSWGRLFVVVFIFVVVVVVFSFLREVICCCCWFTSFVFYRGVGVSLFWFCCVLFICKNDVTARTVLNLGQLCHVKTGAKKNWGKTCCQYCKLTTQKFLSISKYIYLGQVDYDIKGNWQGRRYKR
jgi:hypothetical protein